MCDAILGDAHTIDAHLRLIDKRAAYRKIHMLEAYVAVHTTLRHVEIDFRDADGSWYTSVCCGDGIAFGIGTLTLDRVYTRSSLEPRA